VQQPAKLELGSVQMQQAPKPWALAVGHCTAPAAMAVLVGGEQREGG